MCECVSECVSVSVSVCGVKVRMCVWLVSECACVRELETVTDLLMYPDKLDVAGSDAKRVEVLHCDRVDEAAENELVALTEALLHSEEFW